jgi:hypothetical protein
MRKMRRNALIGTTIAFFNVRLAYGAAGYLYSVMRTTPALPAPPALLAAL